MKYITVLEKQERGAFHAHILLFDIGFLKKEKLDAVWGHGFVWINKLNHLDDCSNAGRYIAKYMEKAIGQELLENKGNKAFYSSRNLKKPKVIKLTGTRALEYPKSELLFESEYIGKVFRNGEYWDNPTTYKKFKLKEGETYDNYYKD